MPAQRPCPQPKERRGAWVRGARAQPDPWPPKCAPNGRPKPPAGSPGSGLAGRGLAAALRGGARVRGTRR